jgi:hypothetical protein
MYLICCGMPRSASTLQYQMFARLIELSGTGVLCGWGWEKIISQPLQDNGRWFIVKVHEPHPEVESQLDPDQTYYAYTYRDLRDAAVSMIQWKGDQFHNIVWMRHWILWNLRCYHYFTRKPHLFLARYEDWTRNLAQEINRAEDFLGIRLDHTDREALAWYLSLEGQREYIRKELLDKTRQACSIMLLNTEQVRDARIGKWKGFLSLEQIRLFDELARDWLLTQGYDAGW